MTAAGAASSAAVLQLDAGAAPADADPLGLWRCLPAPPAEATAFGAAAPEPPAGTVWRVCLPAGPAADTLLTRAELNLAGTQAALVTVEPLLLAFAARQAETPFAGPMRPGRGDELELVQLLAELRAVTADVDAASFALGPLSGLWQQVIDEGRAFLTRLGQATGDPARIETEQGGQLLAVTELSWRDTKTAWLAQLGPEQRTMHERAVRLAFASRLAMMRTFATAIEASVLLAALLTPGGAPHAFPIALRFAARILAEGRSKPAETVAKP